ncbi:MAG: hypothetical protein WDN25_09300 [Acetobacteraceae bacterium]
MTDFESGQTGSGLPDQGMSAIVSIVARELAALGQALTGSAAMLGTITLLGEGMHAFSTNAPAPAAIPGVPPQTDMPTDEIAPDRPARATAAYEHRLDPMATAPTTVPSAAPPAAGAPRQPTAANQVPQPAERRRQPAERRPTVDRTPERQSLRLAHLAPPNRSTVVGAPTPTNAAPMTVAETALPAPHTWTAATAPVGPDETFDEEDRRSAPDTAVAFAPPAVAQPQARPPRIAAGAMAPVRDERPEPFPPSAPAEPVGGEPSAPGAQRQAAGDEAVRSAAWQATTPASQSSLADAEPRQGTLVLDGAQLGRWMLDHLARHAARPGAGVTGIDPRINATYPGAPNGE